MLSPREARAHVNTTRGFFAVTQEIDGEAFLLLSQNDLVRTLRLKLGPALKVHSCITRFLSSQAPS